MLFNDTQILRINLDDKTKDRKDDPVAIDAAICIFINNEFFRTLIASPNMIEELVTGHLISEGIIATISEIEKVEVKQSKVFVDLRTHVDLESFNMSKVDIISTACGSLSTPINDKKLSTLSVSSNITITAEKIWNLVRELNLRSGTYRKTGGTHSALLSTCEGEILHFSEDVGRHNAIDKIIGAGAIRRIDLNKTILVTSGRVSGEIALKAVRARIPIIASVAGPLQSGIRVAKATGITIIGFIRGRKMNVYTHDKHLII